MNLYDYLMSMEIFTLVMNKILIRAPKIMRKMIMGTNWICQSPQINGDTHGEVMSDSGLKQGCPLSPTLFGLNIDELETYLDEINGDSPCLYNTMVAILLYANDVVLHSRLGTSLQRFLSKLYDFCTSSSLEVNLRLKS